jgi:hypothetical protein
MSKHMPNKHFNELIERAFKMTIAEKRTAIQHNVNEVIRLKNEIKGYCHYLDERQRVDHYKEIKRLDKENIILNEIIKAEEKTTKGQAEELGKAFLELMDEIAKSLGLYKLCDKISNKFFNNKSL